MSDFNVSNEIKAQILADRLRALNIEGYGHELWLLQYDAAGLTDSVEAQSSRDAITVIQTAITVCQTEFDGLGA
jgi:hypothetical protein